MQNGRPMVARLGPVKGASCLRQLGVRGDIVREPLFPRAIRQATLVETWCGARLLVSTGGRALAVCADDYWPNRKLCDVSI